MGLFAITSLILLLLPSTGCRHATAPSETKVSSHCERRDPNQALRLYERELPKKNGHDFERLQLLALKLLEEKKEEIDPGEFLSLIIASRLSHHKGLLSIPERGLSHPRMDIQIASLRTLADLQEDEGYQKIVKALQSPYIPVRLEAAYVLAERKYPEIEGHLAAQMNRLPEECLFPFPSLFALSDTPSSRKMLKKFLTGDNEMLRNETLRVITERKMTEFLPEIRLFRDRQDPILQEICAYASGVFRDEESLPFLKELTINSPDPISLVAYYSLYLLGDRSALHSIERKAAEGHLPAIALLGECNGESEPLRALLYHNNPQVRLNAALSLLKKKDPACLPEITRLFTVSEEETAILPYTSPGKMLTTRKIVLKTNRGMKNDPYPYEISDRYKREILSLCAALPEKNFLSFAESVADSGATIFFSPLVRLIEESGTEESIDLLKAWHQKAGHPLLRKRSDLALFRLDRKGPWKEKLFEELRRDTSEDLLPLPVILPWDPAPASSPFEITPEENARLLLEAYLSIAEKQDPEGLKILLNRLNKTSLKNRYILAGILIRAAD